MLESCGLGNPIATKPLAATAVQLTFSIGLLKVLGSGVASNTVKQVPLGSFTTGPAGALANPAISHSGALHSCVTIMRFVLASMLFLLAVVCQLRVTWIFSEMINQVNTILPRESRVPEFGLSLRQARLINLHQQFFPASELRKKLYIGWYVGLAAFLLASACVITPDWSPR